MFNVKGSYAHQGHIFTLIKITKIYCKILSQFSWYCFILEYIPIIPIIPLMEDGFLQSSVSHDPSEIILICWFMIITSVKYDQTMIHSIKYLWISKI